MGNIGFNELCRMDSLLFLLPLVTTRTIELVEYDKLGAGQSATVAVMSYSGYDVEDVIVMNKSSLDRGFGQCIVMKKQPLGMFQNDAKNSDKLFRPQKDGTDKQSQLLDGDGFAAPGERIGANEAYFSKKDANDKPSFLKLKETEGESSVINKAALYTNKKGCMCVKFVTRSTRRPEVGDKFSSRHGQKGACGMIVQQEDFPFTEQGICPGLIMNPHGFPSRMTVGKLIELLGSKAGVSSGRFHYGSAFGEPSGHADGVEIISETLVKHGFSYNGKDFLYSGITDSQGAHCRLMLEGMAPGPRSMITRQPTEGRSKQGGSRVG